MLKNISSIIVILFLVLFTISISKSETEESENLQNRIDVLQNDIKTLEKAVYSLSNSPSVSGASSSLSEEDIMTRHLLKLSEIEEQFKIFDNNPVDISNVDADKKKIEDGLSEVNSQLEKVGVKTKEIEDQSKDKKKEFVEDKKKKDKSQEENSVKLSKSTASLVRTEYEQGKGKKDNKDQSKKEIQKQEPVVPRKETEKEVQEKMQGPPPGEIGRAHV